MIVSKSDILPTAIESLQGVLDKLPEWEKENAIHKNMILYLEFRLNSIKDLLESLLNSNTITSLTPEQIEALCQTTFMTALSDRSRKILQENYDIIYFGDIVTKPKDFFIKIPNLGKEIYEELDYEMITYYKNIGLDFGMNISEWPSIRQKLEE